MSDTAGDGLCQQNAVLAGINRIFREVITGQTEEELGRICLAVAEELTQSRFGFIGEMSAQGRLDNVAISDPGWVACRIGAPEGHGRVPIGFRIHGLYGRVLKESRGFYTNNPGAEPDSIGVPEGHPPLSAFLGVPLMDEGKTIGMVGLGNREGGYREEDLEAMEALAPAIVQVLLRTRAEDELRRSQALLKVITDGSPDPIFLKDRESRVILANPATLAVVGKPAGQVIGRTDSEFYDDPDVGRAIMATDRAVMESGHTQVVEETVLSPEGRRIFLSTKTPWRDAAGQVIGLLGVSRDITAQKQVEKERDRLLQLSETRRRLFEAIFDNIDAPITVLRGTDLIHELVNPRWQALKPWIDMQGKPYLEVWPEFAPWVGILQDIMRSGTPFVAKDALFPIGPAPDAPPEERHFSVHIVPIFDPELKEPALLVLDIETTEEVRARHEVEAALRLRDEFLGVAAHELKTPITSLRGYAELTLKRMDAGRIADPQEVHRAFETIDRQAERLAILTNQLLDLTGLESGELTLRRQETDLVALARGLVDTMQSATTRHALTLQAPAALTANVDPERLRLVLYNLIDNAIKYSPEGGPVEVDVSAPDPRTVRIGVRDYGIGIPPEQRPQLFTRFFKAGAERPAGGLGLGLYIGQRLVALHGGRMWAEFPADGGSRFVVELPRGSEPV